MFLKGKSNNNNNEEEKNEEINIKINVYGQYMYVKSDRNWKKCVMCLFFGCDYDEFKGLPYDVRWADTHDASDLLILVIFNYIFF